MLEDVDIDNTPIVSIVSLGEKNYENFIVYKDDYVIKPLRKTSN